MKVLYVPVHIACPSLPGEKYEPRAASPLMHTKLSLAASEKGAQLINIKITSYNANRI